MSDGPAAAPADDVLAAFEAHRRLLFTVAYELLGTVADAEDAVQDAWLRWSAADRSDVDHPRAYLVRVVTRVALNRLRSAAVRRESYVGPWLPEPVLTAATPVAPAAAVVPDVGDRVVRDAALADAVSLAMLVVLESLSPSERAVFVLHDVFGLSHAEVARALDKSEPAVRQLAHRARSHVEARRPRYPADPQVHLDVTQRFAAACAGGALGPLLDVLAPDVVLVSDGGGVVRAARRPVEGADAVGRFVLGIVAKAPEGFTVDLAEVNGAPALVARHDGTVLSCLQLVVEEGRVARVLVVANPEKLARLDAVRPLAG